MRDMIRIVSKIKAMKDSFSSSEERIANFIINNTNEILQYTITDFSKACETSESTITRFVHKIGFNKFQELKLSIATEADIKPLNENIKETDSPFEIFKKVCEDIYTSLEKTKNIINSVTLKKCCEILRHADFVAIFGLGNSASIATDAAHKLFRLGINAHAYTDGHMQAIASTHRSQNSVIIGISNSGHSKDIIDAMKIAKEHGATTIAITNHQKSPINKVSDFSIETISDETNYRILGLNSRITQLAIVDTIYSYLVCHLQNSKSNIKVVENALQYKKI